MGSAGAWLGYSNSYVPRIVRGFVEETKRGISPAPFTPKPSEWDANGVTAAWLGHATVLINFYGVTILTDPVLFGRVGADVGLGTVGPKRLVEPALSLKQLPPIDLVLLSHAHLDHFDVPTLKYFSPWTKAVTARATTDIFSETRMTQISELGWGDRAEVGTRNGSLRLQAFEVKHWGARWRTDKHRGYNGYVIERNGKKILFAGDTAFSENFAGLRSMGPFELAIMPIGAYEPWIQSHCTPEEAVTMANQAGAKYILPIHHGTFALGREGPIEPLERFEACLTNEAERIAVRRIGETFELTQSA